MISLVLRTERMHVGKNTYTFKGYHTNQIDITLHTKKVENIVDFHLNIKITKSYKDF